METRQPVRERVTELPRDPVRVRCGETLATRDDTKPVDLPRHPPNGHQGIPAPFVAHSDEGRRAQRTRGSEPLIPITPRRRTWHCPRQWVPTHEVGRWRDTAGARSTARSW